VSRALTTVLETVGLPHHPSMGELRHHRRRVDRNRTPRLPASAPAGNFRLRAIIAGSILVILAVTAMLWRSEPEPGEEREQGTPAATNAPRAAPVPLPATSTESSEPLSSRPAREDGTPEGIVGLLTGPRDDLGTAPTLIDVLDDPYLLNRQFARIALERMLDVRLEDHGYQFYQTPEERRGPLARVREALLSDQPAR
jgi:hypothetical protein